MLPKTPSGLLKHVGAAMGLAAVVEDSAILRALLLSRHYQGERSERDRERKDNQFNNKIKKLNNGKYSIIL